MFPKKRKKRKSRTPPMGARVSPRAGAGTRLPHLHPSVIICIANDHRWRLCARLIAAGFGIAAGWRWFLTACCPFAGGRWLSTFSRSPLWPRPDPIHGDRCGVWLFTNCYSVVWGRPCWRLGFVHLVNGRARPHYHLTVGFPRILELVSGVRWWRFVAVVIARC